MYLLGKSIDDLRYTHALSTKSANLFHTAEPINRQVSFTFSKDSVLTFSNPETERWHADISYAVKNSSTGLTDFEIKKAIRLTSALASLTTNIIPTKSNSNLCKDAIVLRTLRTKTKF